MVDYSAGDYISSVDINNLNRKSEGLGILTGLSASASPSTLSVIISTGTARLGSNISPTFITLSTPSTQSLNADSNYPRWASIYLNTDGSVSKSMGIVSSAIPEGESGRGVQYPIPPLIPETSILISEVWIPAGSTIGSQLTLYNNNPINYGGGGGLTSITLSDWFNSGQVIITASNSCVTISTTLSDTNSVFLTPKDNLGGREMYVTSVSTSSFVITLSTYDSIDHTVSWAVF